MPECDVLTEGVVKKISDWQKRGGKIIADEFLCPGLKADLVISSFKREKNAVKDKAAVLALAGTLPDRLQALGWKPLVQTDNPEIITRTRRSGEVLYVFVVNDHREPGTYVGQHGLVMENGLPSRGTLTLNQDSASVYDLTGHGLIVPSRAAEGRLNWPVNLGPGEGRIYMVTPKPLLKLSLDVPATATCGNAAKVEVSLTTTDDALVPGHVPVKVDIRDANGVRTEGSGYYALEKGRLELSLDIASNEDPGTWQIQVRDLASGMEKTQWMQVSRK